MANIISKINAEVDYIERTIPDIQFAFDKKHLNPLEIRGLAKCIHEIYNGMENILKQILASKGIPCPQSRDWHRDLIKLAISNFIIPETLAPEIFDYLGFRHVAVHTYGVNLDEERVLELAKNIPPVWNQFLSEIRKTYRL